MKHLKKWLTIIVTLASVFILCSCGRQQSKSKTLTIGTVMNNSPYCAGQPGQLTGYDIKLGTAIAQKTGMKPKFITYQTDEDLLAGLRHGKVMVALGATDLINLPDGKYSTSSPYLYPTNVLFTTTANKHSTVTGMTGCAVGMLKNGNQATLLRRLVFRPKQYQSMNALISAINRGQVQAGIVTNFQYTNYLKDHPSLVQPMNPANTTERGKVLKQIKGNGIYAQQLVAVTYHHKQVTQTVNRAIDDLRNEGTLAKLSQQFFQRDMSKQ
ncbi:MULTISPECIES: transporter substrate-binding domain-containing protein [unclassified Ligilactobacillus]|uniref:transporter substrate-binding domain-containing protein n=1 Tax=unclassified Ligilactobacillus TaxID=2767920 RepID=UPI00385501A6